MKAHDIHATLSRLRELRIAPDATAGEADAAFTKLAPFGQGGLYVGRFSGHAPWERHPTGDELLHVLDGEVEITVLTEGEPVRLTLGAGSVFVVPRGSWHRQLARATVTLLSATPAPSDVSFAADPRVEA